MISNSSLQEKGAIVAKGKWHRDDKVNFSYTAIGCNFYKI